EVNCPFCEAHLPEQPPLTGGPRETRRLSRAALVAMGGIVAACGGRAAENSELADGTGGDFSTGGYPDNSGGIYGAPPTGGAPAGTGGWEPVNSGGIYGVAPLGGWGGANPDGGGAGPEDPE